MKITIKSVIIFLGAILAFGGFAMMFIDPLNLLAPDILDGGTLKVVKAIPWQQVYLGIKEGSEETVAHSFISLLGFALMGLGGVTALGLTSLGGKSKVYFTTLLIGLVTVILMVGGGILAYYTETTYLAALGIAKDSVLDLYEATTSPTIALALGSAGAGLTLIGCLLPCTKK